MEKFFHSSERIEEDEIICSECASTKCERRFSNVGNRVWLDAKEFYNQKIKPDAERIVDKMNNGSDKDFFDVCGDK
jgi:hypothetical protein